MRRLWIWVTLSFVIGIFPVLPIWIHGNPILLNDMLLAYYAYFADFHRNWSWSHPLPLWSDSYQCGMPMHAYWQSAQLYPLTWILFGPFDPINTIYLFYALHFGLAIAGFLMLGPELGLIRLASFWSGLAFGLSGTMLARYEHPTFLAGWAYLPLLLGLYLRVERKPTWKNTLWLALALTLQTLGGHPQATIATAVLLLLFFLRGLLSKKIPKSHLRSPVAATVVAALFCLPLFLPFLDFLDNTERYDGSAWEAQSATVGGAEEKLSAGVFRFEKFATGGLRPVHLLSLVLPRALGTPAQATWWGGETWGEVFLFIGAAGILVCLFASPARAGPRMRWLWLCGLIALWLACGSHLFASQILYHVPIFNNFRRPARWLILFVLALAALSGHGFQRWLAGKNRTRWLLGIAGCGLLVFLVTAMLTALPGATEKILRSAVSLKHLDPVRDYSPKVHDLLRGWRWDALMLAFSALVLTLRPRIGSRRLFPVLFLLLAADLLHMHWLHFYPFPRDYYRSPPRTLAVMDLSTQPFWRVDHYLEYPGTEMWQMHHDPTKRLDLFEREKLALGYGIHAVFGVKHVSAHMPLLWPWDSTLTPGEKSARYFLSNRDLTQFHGSPLQYLARYDSVRVYEVRDWKPRLQLLQAMPFLTPLGGVPCPVGFSQWDGLCLSEPRDGSLEVTGMFQSGDTLVFREHWHKGWRVRVDGKAWGKPLRYRGVFMALAFSEAAAQVEWEF